MITRRSFLCLASGLATTIARPALSRAGAKARVVVIGGGFGGATCAKYLRRADSLLDVTLVTPQPHFISCPFSNAVVTGLQPLTTITHTMTPSGDATGFGCCTMLRLISTLSNTA